VILQLLEDGESESDLGAVAVAPAAAPTPEAAPAPETSSAPEMHSSMLRGAPSAAIVPNDPSIPTNIKMVDTTVRDALRDAMAEEMRRDETVFVMGEEVAQYQGAYKVTRELLQEFGESMVLQVSVSALRWAVCGLSLNL